MSETPVISRPNRVQRRIKARNEQREVRHRLTMMVRAMRRSGYYGLQCPRCKLQFLGVTANRCQCQVEQRRQCEMCDTTFMASQQYWRENNVCPKCLEEWNSNVASWSAAADVINDRLAYGDEEHRQAQEKQSV